MTERTIDILVRLNSKPADSKKLLDDFKALEKEAEKLQKILKGTLAMEGPDGAQSKRLKRELEEVNQKMKAIGVEAQKQKIAKSLESAAVKAGKLKQQLENIGRVGNTLAIGAAAILAPLVMAVNKYKDSLGETEPTSKRLVDLSKRWEETQIKLGRVIAEQVLPHLEKALDYVDKAVQFAEDNPDFVKAAITVVGAIGILGTILSGIATVGQALVAMQGIATFLGVGGTATAAATGTATAATTAVSSATISAGLLSAVGSALFLATITLAAAEGTRQIFNAITGQNQTWGDILTTLGQLLIMSAEGWDIVFGFLGIDTNFSAALANAFNLSDLNLKDAMFASIRESIRAFSANLADAAANIVNGIGNWIAEMSQKIWDGISNLGSDIVSSITGLFSAIPGKADGGPISGPALFMGGERGREFVMSNRTTKAAENIIGGTLTQQRLLQALSGGGKKVSYYDARRFDASVSANDRRIIRNETMLSLSEALG